MAEKKIKVKVLRGFQDKTDKLSVREKNDELFVTEDRAKELECLGFVKRIQESVEKAEKNNPN